MTTPKCKKGIHTKATVVDEIRPCCYQKRAQMPAAMDSCFELVGLHQHGRASKGALGSHMMNINVMKK